MDSLMQSIKPVRLEVPQDTGDLLWGLIGKNQNYGKEFMGADFI
jgi:hypothetical protein